ncbi:MAG TPA: universal stress protein [Burkholderiales bacterium]|nr:universal stress protein [Burkholderiales bacterium]
MTYKTIVVHLDAGRRRRARLDLAFRLAERFDAHLIGVFGLEPVVLPSLPEVATPTLIETIHAQRHAASEEAAAEFRDKMQKEQYTAKSEWRATLDDGFAALELQAKYADLVLAGQPDPAGDGVPAAFAHRLVMSIGRPVLYVPFAGRFEDCGSRVLVAWNASRESARAVHDALPLLREAEQAEVATFAAEKIFPGEDALYDPEMAAYLARHGARVTLASEPGADIDTGSLILSRAAERGSDLIVMGAYSHSRVRELVLGGATRELFRSMTVPTLMSH